MSDTKVRGRLVARGKEDKQNTRVFALLERDGKVSVVAEKAWKDRAGVKAWKIQLDDGRVLSSETHWLNFYADEPKAETQQSLPTEDDKIPF